MTQLANQSIINGALRRALVVEDSIVIAMEAEDCLHELGIADVEVAHSVESALVALEHGDFDLAILDYSLGDETSDAVAERLVRRGIPFAIATGYDDLESHFSELGAIAVLTKPFSAGDLRDLLQLVARAEAA